MGLFGALFAGVSGLDSQSNKISIISNNIANVNTVGFKQGSADFNTLVVPSGSTSFSPGGVIGNNSQLINQQGLIQATSSSTDVAISGGGFFVVSATADGSGSELLSRAGSFTQDSLGNFVNADGYYLQGIPVTTPPTALNAGNLKTVNVNESASGTATPTSLITLAANFDASQAVLLGSGQKTNLSADSANSSNTATSILVPTSGATGNNLVRGDSFSIVSNPVGKTDNFIYGGFAASRSITAALGTTTGDGTGATTALDTETLVANQITTDGSTDGVKIVVPNAADYTNASPNNTILISGATAVGGISADNLNGLRTISSINYATNTITFTAGAASTSATSGGGTPTVSNRSYGFTGNVLNATNESQDFMTGITSPSTTFTSNALEFKIATTNDGTFTFQYSTQADATLGQFNSLDTLATAINEGSSNELTARVQNGQLYVSATDANQGLTFSNGDPTGSGTQSGINWVQELNLSSQYTGQAASGTYRYNSLQGLANQINAQDSTNLIATVNNAAGTNASISINEADPLQTITFTDGDTASGATKPINTGASIIQNLGFTGSSTINNGQTIVNTNPLVSNGTSTVGSYTQYTTGVLPITYSAAGKVSDMSSGAVTPQFTKDINIFDSLGNSHTIALNVVKLGVNKWGVELTSVPASDVQSTTNDGQIASGIVTFNGDGTLQSVAEEPGTSDSIANPVTINWTQSGPSAVGANQSVINVNLGTAGTSTGLTQSSSSFNVSVANQNGSSVGELTGVSITAEGFVVAAYSNGQTQQIFQIPLANVNNPDGLESISGNAYQQTLDSGQVNLDVAGTNGTGTISPSSLEQSNVDLSTQLTNLIVAQQAYGANSKVLTIADQLLQQLDQIIQ